MNKIAVFIDGLNLYRTGKALGFDVDFPRLLQEFRRRGQLLRAYYYTTISEEFASYNALVNFLDYNGFTVRLRRTQHLQGSETRKKVFIGLVVDAMEIASYVDHIYLVSGDGDFAPLVGALQRKSVQVHIVSSRVAKPSMISHELRRQANGFIELHSLRDAIMRIRDNAKQR